MSPCVKTLITSVLASCVAQGRDLYGQTELVGNTTNHSKDVETNFTAALCNVAHETNNDLTGSLPHKSKLILCILFPNHKKKKLFTM